MAIAGGTALERYVRDLFDAPLAFPRGGKLVPLRLLRPCGKLDSQGRAEEGRNQFKLDWTGLKWDPRGLPRKLARGAALRGHPGQVRMLQKMPKY